MFFKVGDIVTVIDLDTYEKIDGSNIGFYNIDSRIMRAMPIAMINEYRGHKVEIKGTENDIYRIQGSFYAFTDQMFEEAQKYFTEIQNDPKDFLLEGRAVSFINNSCTGIIHNDCIYTKNNFAIPISQYKKLEESYCLYDNACNSNFNIDVVYGMTVNYYGCSVYANNLFDVSKREVLT